MSSTLIPDGTWTESVHLDCVTADGSAAVSARLARVPSAGAASIWFVAVLPNGTELSYVDNALPLAGAEPTDAEGDDARYALDGAIPAVFTRTGGRGAVMAGGRAELAIPAHRLAHPPEGPGDAAVRAVLDFEPLLAAGGSLADRVEVFGAVRATVTWGDTTVSIEGYGHWHEQHQTRPRFQRGFTYASLRNGHFGTIAIATAGAGSGFVAEPSSVTRLSRVAIGEPGSTRRVELVREDDVKLSGSVEVRQQHSVIIDGRRRPGAIVVGELNGEPVSGFVNDWTPPAA